MFKEDPPTTASAPNRRRTKFTAIASALQADPGVFFNITEDVLEGEDTERGEPYFLELARSIGAGNRAAFKPRGAYEGRAAGLQIWARYVPEDQRTVVAAEAADAPAAETADA